MLNASALSCTRGGRDLFVGLGFTLAPQTMLLVHGANGSGKTSLLRIVCGLSPPTAGYLTWNGHNIRSERELFYADLTYIGHLNSLKDELSAIENLQFAACIAGLSTDATSIDAALCRLGLNGFQHVACRALSQGQRRRVALARLSLSARKPLWVLDEPFTALDANAIAVMQELIESHLHDNGMVILTTHQDVPISAPHVQRVELNS